MIRGILLLSLLALLACGAFLYHQVRFSNAAGPEIAPVGTQRKSKEVIFELGGTPPPAEAAPKPTSPSEGDVKVPSTPEKPTETAPEKGGAIPVNDPKKRDPARPAEPQDVPVGANTVKMAAGETLYAIAVKYYGSGAPPVRKDIAAASKIQDDSKIREGTTLVLPAVAGGKKRK